MADAFAAATARPRVVLVPALLGLAGLAWVALLAWEASDLAHAMHVPALGAPALACERGSPAGRAALYLGGWLLMSVAMMLPTTLPLVRVFARLVQRRPQRGLLLALLLGGYLLAWLAFGAVAHALHAALGAWKDGTGWLWTHAWVPAAATLALAGAFQFSRLKHRCLTACRSPAAFVAGRWGGVAPRRDALRIGVAHGVFCVGCCWALMLLMFTAGLGNVAWMLVLGLVMAIEKNASWGRRVGAPLGVALLAAAAAVAIAALAPPVVPRAEPTLSRADASPAADRSFRAWPAGR
ncbi:MAG: hypothetical protein BroJett026_09350 [Betaproteobacteria bacterium]|nr:MAG: hypothetical protein BroJett026_09350 [Betaproteobacteria bacterium]